MIFHRHIFGMIVWCVVLPCMLWAQTPASPAVAKIAKIEKGPPESAWRMKMVRVQILLDRAKFRPGKIDGLGGEFTQKAADRYCTAMGLPPGSLLDTSEFETPFVEYTATEADLQWLGPQAAKPADQAKLKSLKYSDLWELVAERFHCDLQYLRELNPDLASIRAGSVFRVPNVEPFEMDAVVVLEKQRISEEKARKEEAKARAEAAASSGEDTTPTPPPEPESALQESAVRLVLSRSQRLIEVVEEDKLIACFPCTPGSSRVPVVLGEWKVTANILMPYFRWDKSVLDNGVRSDTAHNLPPGPNNPVGIVWIAINRKSIGMHGTSSPDQIGRNQSSGCIRLANWDAFLLSQLVKKGTPLHVVE